MGRVPHLPPSRPGDDLPPAGVDTGRPGARRALVVAAVALAAVWLLLDRPPNAPVDEPGSAAEGPGAGPGGEPAAAVLPDPPTLGRLTGSDHTLVVALSSTEGGSSRVLRWPAGAPSPTLQADVDLEAPALDRSGAWVAGWRQARSTGGGQVLYAGPVGERPEPVALGVGAFAWHDTRAGLLGWSHSSHLTTRIDVLDLGGPRRWEPLEVEPWLRLRHWGDWGLALSGPRAVNHTIWLARHGERVAAVSGYPGGWVPAGLVTTVTHPPPAAVTVVDPASGASPAGWARPGEFARQVSVSPAGGHTAVHLARGGPRATGGGGRVVVLERDGRPALTVQGVPGPAALAWSPDGATLALARQGGGAVPVVVLVEVATGTERTVILPGVASGRDRIDAVALVDPVVRYRAPWIAVPGPSGRR